MEDVKKCKACQSDIPTLAYKCLRCGKDQRNWFLRNKAVSIVIVVIAFISISNALFSKNGENTVKVSNSNTTKTYAQNITPAPSPTPIKISGVEICDEYDNNIIRADSKYTENLVEITAEILDVNKDIDGNPYIRTYVGESRNIYFYFKNPSNEQIKFIGNLSPNHMATIQGTCKGVTGAIMKNLRIHDCVLISFRNLNDSEKRPTRNSILYDMYNK